MFDGKYRLWHNDGDGTPLDFGVPYGPPPYVTTLLPDSSTALERAIAEVDAWRMEAVDTDIIRRIHRPDECPPAFLPILAWEYSVDEWDPEWTVAAKREAIKQSFEVHRHKGTAYAVERAVTALNYGGRVEEWFEYGGSAYRFRVVVQLGEEEPWDGKRASTLVRVALRTKNVRSRLEAIHLRRQSRIGGPYIGAFVQSRLVTRLIPDVPSEISVAPYLYIGAVVSVRSKTTLRDR
ncbi:phage tail protein I [Shinella yambaruensis]|uniref:Phage tail protein I n=1 Tax=Shinella yambaruensis TaxID=415996 RepID=A0ABQ5ZKX3_9HYPH|nr:phage tail protein I [Shinella yambaruensis]MCJ8027006.1 phage tail protein I [Shinella yambaruensis]MCU7982102.1 phage tail protein I [Shinella yambaruensis]GLR51277.1 hypothetical protein GCM10007923_24850 [Shinella yambaruensis]